VNLRARLLPIGLAVLLAGGHVQARAGEKPAAGGPLDTLLEAVRAKTRVPALAGAIVTSRGLVAQGAVGIRAVGSDAKVTQADLWHIGSCTKSMTATLVARLVEQGVLHWNTTLAAAFPKLAPAMDPAWRGVTLDLLLHNRGGAPRTLDAHGLWQRLWAHRGNPVQARRLLLEGVTAHPPDSKPGTKYEYSNAGFAMAGHVAETMAGKPYEALLQEQVCKPLGMTTVGFGAPGTASEVDQPRGHVERGGTLVAVTPGPRADNPPAITPAGRVHLSLADWGRYVSFHLAARQPGAKTTFLRPATVLRLHTPLPGQDYAMGWGTTQRAWGGAVLTHTGSNTMWYAVTWLAPQKDFAVLVTCNVGGDLGAKATDQAAWALIQWYQRQAK
jgi:CubicO group peptidase (beta-lactamase class C family)